MLLILVLVAATLIAQSPPLAEKERAEALHLQVRLDRAGFSPGIIDGRPGSNTSRALALYEQQRRSGPPDVPALASYTITSADTAGPFVEHTPSDLVEQASLPALGYTSVLEALGERFHTTPELLQHLNPGARFAAGEQIQVPNVDPLVMLAGWPPGAPLDTPASADKEGPDIVMSRPDVVVRVSEREAVLTVTGSSGEVVFSAPVTTGSEQDPLPIGEWKVDGLHYNPVFHYNPALFWDADSDQVKAKIPPGPNNPVGLVWIDLDKEHYGIHGTPEPASIGRTQSHGCVRLTNWDALRLAGMVKPGTKVIFED